jgi:UDP-2,3-diacylglucosamine hydrolase
VARVTSGRPLGLIAGNGRFPFLVAAGARRAGRRVVTVAIREETSPELEREVDELHWVGLGQLGRAIDALRQGGVTEAVMAGQVQHRRIFSNIVPDLKLLSLLARLAVKNTDSLIGAVADFLEGEGIRLLSSVTFLEDHLATAGVMTRHKASRAEMESVAYGVEIASALTRLDLGQTVVVKDRAAVALEAMEGTDETIRRAGAIAGRGVVVVKLAKPKQDMRFDVPVVGARTLETMAEAGAAVLAVETGKTLLFDKAELLADADRRGLAIVGVTRPAGPA